jgi:hypothetical protein
MRDRIRIREINGEVLFPIAIGRLERSEGEKNNRIVKRI